MAFWDSDTTRTFIDRRNRELCRWYAEGNIESVAAAFAEDAWQMPPNAPPLVGREAIRSFWSQAVQWGKWEFNLDAQQIDVGGSIAVERGKYRLRFTAGPGVPDRISSFEDWGNYLVHWRLESDDRWHIVGDAPVSERPVESGTFR